MPQLSHLMTRLPECKNVSMSTMGQILWLAWEGALPQAVTQTMLNYGGMQVVDGNDQAVWFFFTDDVFLALARLSVWGNFNALPISVELFPGKLQLGTKREASLVVDAIIQAQELHPGDSLDIFVHPKSREGRGALPGITFEPARLRQGMASIAWESPIVDARLPYSSTQSWFVVLHPLGNPLDKNYQTGWPAMFKRLEEIFRQHKLKFIVHENFVLVSADNLLMLRTFLSEYLSAFNKETNGPEGCWPCVCVVADRKNYNFNTDLPRKIGLKWDSLMPDFPYVSYRNAYLLGERFIIRDLNFRGGQSGMDSWCNIILNENSISSRSIPLVMSAELAQTNNEQGCFYCGLHNHASNQCPTRTYYPTSPQTLENLATLGLEDINEAFRSIEVTLGKKGVAGFNKLMDADENPAKLLRAIFDINGPDQLRNVPKNWLYRLREPEPGEEEPLKDDSPAWDLLEKLKKTDRDDLAALDKEIAEAITRNQRDPRLRMVRAFTLLEKGDSRQALAMFREAAAITPYISLQAWNEYLQGRLHEEMGQLTEAAALYAGVLRVMPQWKDIAYRGIVCRVKMGFAEQVLGQVVSMVNSDPEYFNRFLIDPALERGRLLILSALHDLWDAARQKADAERSAVQALATKLSAWFPDDHPVQALLGHKIRKLEALGAIDNYMAFFQMVRLRPQLEKELDDSIQREVEDLRNRYKAYLDVLEEIRDEASWFPFPSALRDFSSDFNSAAGLINWAFSSNFNESETFKKAQSSIPKLDELLLNLKKRLKFLRTVRDGTLFGLTMTRTFLWVEITGLLICFLGVPAIVLFGEKFGMGWLKYLIGENQWSIQKVLVVIVTILAIGLAALRSTLVFDRKREKLLEQAREQREKYQQTRVEAIRKQRQAMAKKQQKEREAARKIAEKRQLKARMEN